MPTTPTKEDYVETIWSLISNKGYARVTDIGERLGINNASVTKMIQKLDGDGILVYEKYRGIDLTQEGYQLGQKLSERHRILEQFLLQLGAKNHTEVFQTVEGIEHYIDANTLSLISHLLEFIQKNPEWWAKFFHESDK